jgi:hypothetical protein
MNAKGKQVSAPGFVILRQMPDGQWQMLGEVPRKRGLPARAARSQAILDATKGTAKAGEVYAAILRSEWLLRWTGLPRQIINCFWEIATVLLMNTALKWLVLASITNLVGNSFGTVIAFQQNLTADWGGSLNGQNVLRDFLGFRGTALSAPLPFMLTQLMITLLVLRPGRSRLIGVAALTFVGLFYTLAQAGEPIVLRLLSPGGFNLAQALAFIVNEASAIAMLIMGIRAWRIVRPQP